MSALLLLLSDDASPGADVSFNGPMLALPYSLQRLGFTYTRNSAKTVYQGGSLVTLSANQFGTTYDAVTGLNAFEAELAATNLALNSAGAAATWTVSNVVDAVTPIAGFAASLAFGDNSVVRAAYKSVTTTNGVTYTVSVFVEMDDGLAPVVGATNSTGDFCIVVEGDVATANILVNRIGTSSVYRVSASKAAATPIVSINGIAKYTTQSTRTFRIIGIQVETGSRATSYIATAGATVARAADVLSCATANIPGFNAAGYTLVVDGRMDVAATATTPLISVNDGPTNNRSVIRSAATASVNTATVSGGIAQASTTEGSVGVARFKAAYSSAANSFLRAVNGITGTADTGGSMPVAPNALNIGHEAGIAHLNGFIYGFKLIPTALNQAQTTGLTV